MKDFDYIFHRGMAMYPHFLFTNSNKILLSAGCDNLSHITPRNGGTAGGISLSAELGTVRTREREPSILSVMARHTIMTHHTYVGQIKGPRRTHGLLKYPPAVGRTAGECDAPTRLVRAESKRSPKRVSAAHSSRALVYVTVDTSV